MEERPCTIPMALVEKLSTQKVTRPRPLAEKPGSLQWDARGPLSLVTPLQTFLSPARLTSLQNNGFPV